MSSIGQLPVVMRILLLSLYYPPLNTIAALRLGAFHKFLSAQGLEVDVITRYYDPAQIRGASMLLGSESSENFDVRYVKHGNVIYTNFHKSNPVLTRSQKLPPGIRGMYNYLQVDVIHYSWLDQVKNAFEAELKENKYDLLLSSYGPPIMMLVAKELSRLYKIPYVVDFRDSYINEQDKGFHLLMKRYIQNSVLKNASGFVFATQAMADLFQKNSNNRLKQTPQVVVYNGVDPETISASFSSEDKGIVERFNRLKESHSMVFLHAGTLYDGQNLGFFINALDQYNKKFDTNCVIVLVGLSENNNKIFHDRSSVIVLPKVSHSSSMFLQSKADALLLPIWDGRYSGFSGKTLEYLYSENFILTSPNPQNDLMDFFSISPNVRISKDAASFERIVDDIRTGKDQKKPITTKDRLFRSYWINELGEFIKKLVQND